MSPAESSKTPRVSYRKPRADIYTVLLVISLVAILAAILCLYAEMSMYEFNLEGGPSAAADDPTMVAMIDHRPFADTIYQPLTSRL